MPGFSAPAGMDLANVTRALTRCPEGTFRAGLGAYTAAGVPCTSCGSGLSTLPGIDGATSRDACLVAPGAGFNAATGTAADCPVGSVSRVGVLLGSVFVVVLPPPDFVLCDTSPR